MGNNYSEKEKQIQHERDLQRLQEFRLMDDTFMRAVLKDNLKAAQYILRVVTGLSDLVLTYEKTQEDMKRVTGARSVCLDVYGSDSKNRKYDLEIQKENSGALPKRARYHSSVLDIENLDINQDFEELPETYTIFITEHDIFGEGEPYYIYDWANRMNGKLLGDGAHILYVNGDYHGHDDIGRLMHDLKCKNPADIYNKELAERVRYYKESQKGREEMCQIMEDLREETRVETEERTIIKAIKNLMETLNMTSEQAMDALKVPEKDKLVYRTKL
ncbi:MAG: PD-(D/E)XK nuclease family transposase [Oribacterium sp.]|jgi:hypothetical protein|nr:PD-(D/E)XK nuclease family transposase [Oribacterium sp.]MDY6309541.1 PD-(D/E)XK nuclease family transposase [Oribacterium sp.]MDY6315709.1 PD-(D/E)XK nuclease family transposase [Oribacterium sp.]